MLAKVAMRRALVPAVARRCMSVSAMDAVSAQSAKLAASLPDDLKSIAADGVRLARHPT